MKKFTKILFLLLSLVAIVTAFTVVALAADGEATQTLAPYPAKTSTHKSDDFDHDDYKEGDLLSYTGRSGEANIVIAENGNKYALMQYTGTGTGTAMWGINIAGAKNAADYPYMMFEFDIMTQNGSYAGTSFYSRYYGSRPKLETDAADATDPIKFNSLITETKFTNSNLALSKAPYEWQHLTFIVKFNGDATFTQYAFVNGELKVTEPVKSFAENANWTALNGNYSTISVSEVRIYPTSSISNNSQVGIDNIRVTYFPAEYLNDDITAIANYNYSKYGVVDGFEFPYSATRATIGDVKYEHMEDAIAAAGENDVIKLALDGMTIEVNKAVTIDTNGVSSYTFAKTRYCRYEEIEPGIFKFYEPDEVEVTDSTGTNVYFVEDLYDILNSAEGGDTTVKLLKDVYTEMKKVTLKKSVKIDLNGHEFRRCFVFGPTYVAEKTEDGYNYTDTVYSKDPGTANAYFFGLGSKDGVTLEITSSTGGGAFYNLQMQADTWIYNGKIVKRTETTSTKQFCSGYALSYLEYGDNFTFKLNGGIDVYAGGMLDVRGTESKNVNVEVKNVNYYNLISAPLLRIESNWDIDVLFEDSIFYTIAASGNLFALGSGAPAADAERFGKVIVKNCDLLKNGKGYGQYITNSRGVGNTEIVFDNCRLYDTGTATYNYEPFYAPDTYAINGTIAWYQAGSGQWGGEVCTPVPAKEGWYNYRTSNIKKTYDLPTILGGSSNTKFPMDTTTEIAAPKFEVPHDDINFYFNDVVTRDVTVIFMHNSEEIKKETLKAGVDNITLPTLAYDIPENLYLDVLYNWVDEAGKLLAADTLVGFDKTEYVYTSALPTEDNIQYTAGIDDIYFSYIFYAKFHTIVYLPYVEGMEAPALLKGTASFNAGPYLVRINGDAYWAYNSWDTTTSVADGLNCTATFTVNGETYSQKFHIDALIYAEEILKSPYNDTEKAAIGNFMRYVKMAREEAGLEVSEKFDTLINDSGIAALSESNEAYKDDTIDLDEVFTYVDSIHFAVYDSSTAQYYITLKDTNATLTVSYAGGGNVEFRSGGNGIYYTINTRVYDIINPIKLTITMPDEAAEGGTKTVTVTYSAKAYIYGTNDSFTKAMYEFGVAAKAYRDFLLTL